MMKASSRRWLATLLLGVLLGTPLMGQGEAAPAAEEAVQVKSTAAVRDKAQEKKQLARLRGKLLYKKGQIRKLESGVTENSDDLKNKVAELERQRRDLYLGAEPKLAALYEEHDQLNEQIRQCAEDLKR